MQVWWGLLWAARAFPTMWGRAVAAGPAVPLIFAGPCHLRKLAVSSLFKEKVLATMERAVYRALLDKLALPLSAWPHFAAIARAFGVSTATVFSIYSLEVQSRVLRTNHVVKAAMSTHAQRYLAGDGSLIGGYVIARTIPQLPPPLPPAAAAAARGAAANTPPIPLPCRHGRASAGL